MIGKQTTLRETAYLFSIDRGFRKKEYFQKEKISGWAGIRSAISSGYVNSLV